MVKNKNYSLKHGAHSRKTSLLKTFSWRIIATLTTITLALIFTGEIETALKIGAVEFFAKMIFYYLHERGWVWITQNKKP